MIEKIIFYLATSNYFLLCVKFSPPPFTQAKAAKNITSPIAIFDPCTHEKIFFPPSTKKVVPMCAEETPSASPGILGRGRRSTGLTRMNSTGSVCKVGWVFLYILAPVPPNPHTSDIGIPGQHRDVCQQIVELGGLSEQLNPGAAVSTT